jgi:hypothetical protein
VSYPPSRDRVCDTYISGLIVHVGDGRFDPSACQVAAHRLRPREASPSMTAKSRLNTILLIETHD